MKILIVGSWVSATYEQPLHDAFEDLSHDVHSFKWSNYLKFISNSNKYDVQEGKLKSIWYRFQNKYIVGPSIIEINKSLSKIVVEGSFDLIFLYRATHIWEKTVKEFKVNGAKVMIYNNDDPFTLQLPKYIYRHYFASLKHADWIFAYRTKNIRDYKELGFSNCSLLRSSYIKTKNFPIPHIEKDYDVIFIGHFENDGRDSLIYQLMQTDGIKVGLWGQNWAASRHYSFFKKYMKTEIEPLFGNKYNEMMNRGKIALVFFSKINNDGYTRRCFEIPAAGTMMLCEYSKQMEEMFTQNSEIMYFTSNADAQTKIKYLLENPQKINKIMNLGRKRLIDDNHEITDRAKEILSNVQLAP
jgi:spore maturation protein CgeB